MRRWAVIATLALSAACTPPPPEKATAEVPPAPQGAGAPASAPAQPGALTPAGYGAVRIGMTIAEAEQALGAPLVADMPFDEPELCQTMHVEGDHPALGLTFMALSGRISRISDISPAQTLSPLVHTDKGVGVGSTGDQVRAAYPTGVRQAAFYAGPPSYELVAWTVPEQSGVRFELNDRGQVWAVHAGNRSILNVEGCL